MNIAITYGTINFPNEKRFKDFNVINIKEPTNINPEIDVVIFTGGADISPFIYGEENVMSVTNIKRDIYETLLFTHYYIKSNVKFFGICRGHQFLNAALGGKLTQDLEYFGYGKHPYLHKLDYINGELGEILKEQVNSTHHQGVILHGQGQKVIAKYKDIIEITESKKVLTMQPHPEYFEGWASDFWDYFINWAKRN